MMNNDIEVRDANEDDLDRLFGIEMIWYRSHYPQASEGEVATRGIVMKKKLQEDMAACLKQNGMQIVVAEKKVAPFSVIAYASIEHKDGIMSIRPTRAIDTVDGEIAASHVDNHVDQLVRAKQSSNRHVIMMGNTMAIVEMTSIVAQAPVQVKRDPIVINASSTQFARIRPQPVN
jgi:hypothetical protein